MSAFRRIFKAIDPRPDKHLKDKAIAVGLALMVWVAVNVEEAVPEIFEPVPVVLENLPPDLAIAGDYTQTISVRARGSQRDLSNLTQGRLSPRIDLTAASGGQNVFQIIPEDLNAPSGVQIERIDPAEITIVLEDSLEKYVVISPVTSGEPAAGYEIVGRSTEPEMTRVSGPRSVVEAIERIETSTVDVRGRNESFTQMVTLLSGNTFLELREGREVNLQVDILEQPVTINFEEVPVEVINAQYQVAVNPDHLTVFLRGPPSLLEQIDLEILRLVIDAAELAPQAEDYLIAPSIDFAQEGLGELIELVTTIPQRQINVHVFDQRSR
jgi:hypothetical protein